MARSGLTRQEKTAVVRAALIDTAARMFATQGFDRTSLDSVAEQAGVTKGAVYSNFVDKEDLFFAACRSVAAGGNDSTLGGAGPLPSRLSQWARSVAQITSEPGSDLRSALDAEALQLALRSERTRAWVAAQNAEARARLASVLARSDQSGAPLAQSPDELATILLALLRGLLMERTITPETVPDHYFADAVRFVLAGSAPATG